jgi:UDP-2,3-diacylglucosamine hydrolase
MSAQAPRPPAPPLEVREPLGPGTLFLADLHLDAWRAEPGRRFAAWVDALPELPALVVLGDLFDAWVSPRQLELPGVAEVCRALAARAARGTRLWLVPGNRDFLLGAAFERASGARLAPAGALFACGTSRLLALHGDELCTLDRAYQRLRRVMRSPLVLGLAPRVPLALGGAIGRRLRTASTRAVAAKPPAEKAMQAGEAERRLAAARADVLVCGHAHEFRDERLAAGRWIVLDAFGGARDLLAVGAEGALALGSSDPGR